MVDSEFYRFFGKRDASIKREIFKENKSYVEGMVADIAKYKFEMSTEKDSVTKKAIAEMVNDRFANFDIDKIEDLSLRKFLQDVRNGKYNNMEDK
jgi:hypothetical protein